MSKTTESAERMSQIEAWVKNQKVKFGHVDSDDSGVIPSALKSQPKDDGLMFFVANVRDENYFSHLGKASTKVLKRRADQADGVTEEPSERYTASVNYSPRIE